MRDPVLIATRSAGKLRELRALFAIRGIDACGLQDLAIEPTNAEEELEHASHFEGNALAKARYFYHISGGVPTFADDSGLVVGALNGAPGVRSRRWSGVVGPESVVTAANNALLLQQLTTVSDRCAEFVCAAAFVSATCEIVRLGRVPGRIVDAAKGSSGFGYDPLFLSTELDKTFGEASDAEKTAVSHRARAFRALLDVISLESTTLDC